MHVKYVNTYTPRFCRGKQEFIMGHFLYCTYKYYIPIVILYGHDVALHKRNRVHYIDKFKKTDCITGVRIITPISWHERVACLHNYRPSACLLFETGKYMEIKYCSMGGKFNI